MAELLTSKEQVVLHDGHTTLGEASQLATEMHELAESLAEDCNDSDAAVLSKGAVIMEMLICRVVELACAKSSPETTCSGVKCIHCNGSGVQAQHYDEETGWSDDGIACETCAGTGRLTTVEQYLKTLPANWHEDSSVRTWFPILNDELERLRRAEASCLAEHVKATSNAAPSVAGELLTAPSPEGSGPATVGAEPRKFDAYCTEPAFVLATMALQSDRYVSDTDFRDATDNVLAAYGVPRIIRSAQKTSGEPT